MAMYEAETAALARLELGRRVTESYLIVPLVSRQVSGVRPVREVGNRIRASLPAAIR